MSFGEGDLHAVKDELQAKVDKLEITNGKLCDEINRQELLIRELKALARDTYNAWCFECYPWEDGFSCAYFDGTECDIKRRMSALGLVDDGR